MNLLYKKVRGVVAATLMLGAAVFANNVYAQSSTSQAPPAQQGAAAKTDFSDAEIKQFADANNRLMAVQQEGEKVMLNILQEEKVEVEKFNELAKAYQEQKLEEVSATPEEMAAFNKAAQRIMEMQPTIQRDVEQAIVKDGMSLEKYEQIMLAYQQSPVLQAKVHKMME
ncbi:DUF4168 domain-containing protein [Pontibacter sp. SGAir0037]|uniref:DUF4168 domain-containing protein n=1 Tax=Pontibacter sp. SGAir0037 TaxID=2571030 RepID=UPI0010CD12B1|nr:DUF4168 domain-containing protein [Pontibacter sp. SGAir0037]QCR24137.1 hypothetical protein C1N53_18420 [Pontibacter sp. SGAir0037]